MDTKKQAEEQSKNLFQQAQESFTRYANDPSKAGDIVLPKLSEESWYKEPSRFTNWLLESTVGSVLNIPRNLKVGGEEFRSGLGNLITGQKGAQEQLLRGSGRYLQGVLDVASFVPIGRVAQTTAKLATAEKATVNLGRTVGKEAAIGGAYGAGYGLAGGLQEAALKPSEQRLGTIAQSTALGGLAGGLLGGALPLVGEGIRTYKLNKLENVKPKITSSLEKFNKSNQDELTTGGIKTEIPEVKLPVTKDTSKNITPAGKKRLTQKITSETNTANILPKDKSSKSLVDNINANIAQGNLDGAVELITNAPKKTREKATKFFVTFTEKNPDLPTAEKQALQEIINAGLNPKYTQRKSSEISKVAYKMTQDMSDKEVYDALVGISQILDDTITQFNTIKSQNPNTTVTLEGLININLTNAFGDTYTKTGQTMPDIIGSLLIRAYDRKENQALARKVQETLSRYGTGVGQTLQSFNNLVSTAKVIDELNNLLQTSFGKTDSETAKVAKELKDTAQEILGEFNRINQTVLDEPNVINKILNLSNKVSNIVNQVTNNKVKPLFNLDDFLDMNVIETLDATFIANAWRREIDKLLPDINKKEGKKISESILQSILIGKSELQTKGLKPKIDQEKALYQRLTYAFDYIDEITKKVELAKTKLKDLIKQDPKKLLLAESIFQRMIPEVYVNNQADKMFKYLIRDLKPNFRELATDTKALNIFKKQLTFEFYKRVPASKTKAKNLVNSFINRLEERVEIEKSKIKLPSDLIAKRMEDSIKEPITNDYQKKEQDLNKDIVNQAYLIIKEVKNESIIKETAEGKLISFKDEMNAFREMVGNTKKYAEQWNKARNTLREKYQSDPYVLSKLEAFFNRNIPQVMTNKQIYRTAQKLVKENKYNFYQIIRQSAWNQYTKREDLLATLVSAFEGVDEDLLKPVVDDVFKIINERTNKARQEVLERLLTPKEPREVVRKTASDKILELANLGVFDNTSLTNKLFEMKNLPHVSDETANYIGAQLYLTQLPDGMERKISLETAYQNIGRKLAEENKLNFKNKDDFIAAYNAFFYNNIFSSFQTQERNIFGGLFNALVYKPLTLLGEATMQKFYKSADNVTYKDIATYYKAALGGFKNATDRFVKAFDPDYIPKSEEMDFKYFYREYKKKQLPKPLQFVKNFMEASDQFVASIIEDSTTAVLQNRGVPLQQAQEQAFLVSQELLGKSYFKSTDIKEVGLVDAFFNFIGQKGTQTKGTNSYLNLIMTPIVPVLRLAVNFQKQKAKLFPPLQLINILTKNPTNRKLEDYAYLSVGTGLMAYATQKALDGEIAFEAPKDEASKRLFYDSGRKPYSLKIGDNWIPFQYLELLAAPFMFMGAVQAAYKDDPEALTTSDYAKVEKIMGDFIKAFLVSPTYLANIANAAQAIDNVNGKDYGNVLAYPTTGFVPFIGLIRDIQDIIDPIRRRKTGGWDEWKALYDRQSLEPFFNYNENPVTLSQTELYAPYGIGKVNPEFDNLYRQTLLTKQETRLAQKTIEEDKKRVDEIQRQLFVSLNNNDYNEARRLIIQNKLTPQQVSSVTKRITDREIFSKFTPQERAIYNLSETDATSLIARRPELQQEVNRLQSLKGTIETPRQSIFKDLSALNKPAKIKQTRLRGKRTRIKKVRAKKFKLPKQSKIKKLKPIRIQKLKPLK